MSKVEEGQKRRKIEGQERSKEERGQKRSEVGEVYLPQRRVL